MPGKTATDALASIAAETSPLVTRLPIVFFSMCKNPPIFCLYNRYFLKSRIIPWFPMKTGEIRAMWRNLSAPPVMELQDYTTCNIFTDFSA